MDLKNFIRDVPNFPKPGIMFKDISPLLQDHAAFHHAIQELAKIIRETGAQKVCGIESRGFMFGAPLALELGIGFVPVRKKGKLPWKTHSQAYELEYGTDHIEIHQDAIQPGEKVVVADDLLATGGTAEATAALLEKCGAVIEGFTFLVELEFLKGRDRLTHPVFSLLTY